MEVWHDPEETPAGPPGWAFIVLYGVASIIGLAALGWIVAFFFSSTAAAHEAPKGWSFDTSCCHNRDCGQVPTTWIFEGPDGVTVIPTGEVLAYSDRRIKRSPDGLTYWCRPPDQEWPKTICVYLPPRGM